MLECLFGRDATAGIVDEDLAEEVEELLVEGRGGRNDFLD